MNFLIIGSILIYLGIGIGFVQQEKREREEYDKEEYELWVQIALLLIWPYVFGNLLSKVDHLLWLHKKEKLEQEKK